MALYDDVLNIAREYMGPAAENFMIRRCTSIRIKDPNDLKEEDLDSLAAAIQTTAKLYMSVAQVLSFKQDILDLKIKRK